MLFDVKGVHTMSKLAYPTRILTTAPFMAMLLFTLLYVLDPHTMTDLSHYVCSLVFFTLLPLLAYPLSVMLPQLRQKGRPAQRKLAILFSVIGYLAGILYLILAGGTPAEWMIYLTYAISGAAIALSSFLFHFKASGHACGVSGPAAMLAYWLGTPWLLSYVLLAAVFWASLKMERHTVAQLAAGSLIPVMTLVVLALLPA